MLVKGQIIKQISNLYTVKVGDAIYGCRARGKFRNQKISPLVGDNVMVDIQDNVITEILERRNQLARPVIANVDMAFIVTSVRKPNLDLNLLDKMISIISYNDIEPVICFTKIDLLNPKDVDTINNLRKYYEYLGIKVFYNNEVDDMIDFIKNKVVVLAGQTGAGKSSLLNRLDCNLDIKTAEISEALGRGKHTTRHVELYKIGEGFIADTPGFSALDLKDMTALELRDTFLEFNNYDCKFSDCMHDKEIGCEVKEAVSKKLILQSRYDNYLQFKKEVSK